jgi:putative peptidoglycan lipid II flippase
VARNTAIFSIGTGISRVAGLGREIVAASYFGTSGPASAFTIAFLIPNLVSNLFANAALSAAFVPVFTDLLQQGRRKEAVRLASTLLWIMLIVLGAITAFFILAAGVIMPLFIGPELVSRTDLTIGLSQVLFPVVLLQGVTGLLVGILQSHDEFTIPAISPAVWNLVIIVLLADRLSPAVPHRLARPAHSPGVHADDAGDDWPRDRQPRPVDQFGFRQPGL